MRLDPLPSALSIPLVVALAGMLPAGWANARPTIRASFFGAYPTAVDSRLDDLPSIPNHCGVCHFQFTGGGTRNPYGEAVEAALPNYPNSDAGRQMAIHSIENLDSDGDGYSNLTEITDLTGYFNTPTFSGLTPSNVGSASGVDPNDILAFLVPEEGGDSEPPMVVVNQPNGGENLVGGSAYSITWTATDNVGVTAVDLFYRDSESAPWTMIARDLANSGSFVWFVHNTPTGSTRVQARARDLIGNEGADASNGLFTILHPSGGRVATTLRDFREPGTQPFQGGTFQASFSCSGCHGGYDYEVEPTFNFQGSMMAQAARDPLFYACLAIAEQDAPGSGDLCLRCHAPFGWLSGRSNPTDGSQLTALDRDGVSCDHCHRMVDPIYQPGESPPEDQAVLAALTPADIPTSYANGQYVIDPEARRRGPFDDPIAPHAFLESPLHRGSEFCGTCHDVSNPALMRTGPADYALGPLDQAADSVDSAVLMPLERTFSEWKNSAYNSVPGVYAPEFAGNKPDGYVSTCQDCHLRDVSGVGCNDPDAITRPDLPLHDMTGGNAWVPSILSQIYPGEVNAEALAEGAARAVSMLQKSALLDVGLGAEGDSFRAEVTLTNRTGHKLPTGYPEGRRMWLHLQAMDGSDAVVYESGDYDAATGVLTEDDDIVVYEAKLGLSPGLSSMIGLGAGPSFHFALNDSIYKDNRIPPLGFTNAAFASFGGTPVDPDHEGPGPRYPDGQNWDRATYPLPASTRTVITTLFYQTTSKEYVEFLRDENTSNDAGQTLYNLWTSNGRAAPVVMARDTLNVNVAGLATGKNDPSRLEWLPGPNPFRGDLALRLDLPRPATVVLEVFDLEGRRIARVDSGRYPAGAHRLTWNGRDQQGRDAGSGIFWIRLQANGESLVKKVVRLRG